MPTTPTLSENALTILQTRYLVDGDTPADLYRRVAHAVASVEQEPEVWEERFYELMASGQFLPNSPTLFNAGTGQGTLSACFVIPVEDTMGSIMAAATMSAMIQKFGGGIGYSFGELRPSGSPISSTQGKACGAVAVLKMLANVSDMITQGGKRHGANMGILPVSHPEILDFVHLKDDNTTAQNFNISVAITDAFMLAVQRDEPWDLVNPHTGQTTAQMPARDLWQRIVDGAWRTGDPGLYFIDEANRRNPTPHLGALASTNPCGEVPLLPYEACNLGSLDLASFIVAEPRPGFDYDALDDAVRSAIRFLDDVVSVNVFPDQAVADAVSRTRKIGLGVMGWHDALIKLGVPYADPAALALAHEVMRRINTTARETSAKLAAERGPYPGALPDALDTQVRNATRTCIAPTGSISAIAGCSSGIEPLFALAFVKNVLDGQRLSEVSPYLETVGRERGFWTDEMGDQVAQTGSVQHIDSVPDDVKRLFATAMEIPYEAHVAMQAAFQEHTDLAVSKTINLRHEATRDDVEQAYLLAYRERCIGITVYRDGSKPTQVLQTNAVPGGETSDARVKRDRPKTIRGVTERMRTAHGNAYVTVNFDESGTPFEVFTTIGKAGSTDQAYLEAVSRLISLALRSGIPVIEVIEQLRGITSEPVWDAGRLIMSAPDAVAQVMALHALAGETENEQPIQQAYDTQPSMPLGDLPPGDLQEGPAFPGLTVPAAHGRCPDCNGALVMQESCTACPACGWNRCY